MEKKKKCPDTKRVSGQSRLMLKCRDANNVKGRIREKEREIIRKVPNNRYIKIYKIEGTYA